MITKLKGLGFRKGQWGMLAIFSIVGAVGFYWLGMSWSAVTTDTGKIALEEVLKVFIGVDAAFSAFGVTGYGIMKGRRANTGKRVVQLASAYWLAHLLVSIVVLVSLYGNKHPDPSITLAVLGALLGLAVALTGFVVDIVLE